MKHIMRLSEMEQHYNSLCDGSHPQSSIFPIIIILQNVKAKLMMMMMMKILLGLVESSKSFVVILKPFRDNPRSVESLKALVIQLTSKAKHFCKSKQSCRNRKGK